MGPEGTRRTTHPSQPHRFEPTRRFPRGPLFTLGLAGVLAGCGAPDSGPGGALVADPNRPNFRAADLQRSITIDPTQSSSGGFLLGNVFCPAQQCEVIVHTDVHPVTPLPGYTADGRLRWRLLGAWGESTFSSAGPVINNANGRVVANGKTPVIASFNLQASDLTGIAELTVFWELWVEPPQPSDAPGKGLSRRAPNAWPTKCGDGHFYDVLGHYGEPGTCMEVSAILGWSDPDDRCVAPGQPCDDDRDERPCYSMLCWCGSSGNEDKIEFGKCMFGGDCPIESDCIALCTDRNLDFSHTDYRCDDDE